MPVLMIIVAIALGVSTYKKAHADEFPDARHGPVARPQTVPEPDTLAVLGSGAAAVWLMRRRRK